MNNNELRKLAGLETLTEKLSDVKTKVDMPDGTFTKKAGAIVKALMKAHEVLIMRREGTQLQGIEERMRKLLGGDDGYNSTKRVWRDAGPRKVLVEFGSAEGERWSTVGVSGNIIEASFQALVDAITYRLLKAGAQAVR